jgi:hypothetical protein
LNGLWLVVIEAWLEVKMANPEHLKIIEQGTGVWNKWREENPITPNLADADLSEVDLIGANLIGANLIGANLSEADLIEADLSEANLTGADLTGVDLRGADLRGADLRRTGLRRANLTEADLREANLSEADLSGAYLSEAYLRGADLTGADLAGADLFGVNLTRTNLQGTHWHRTSVFQTIFADVDLSEAIGLDQVRHLGPSTIGINTIYRSKGNIPEVFLRGAGVPKDLIDYIPSLVGQPFQFYSCFISYSSKNEAFVSRLHGDLQAKGVQNWYAPKDLKTGDKFPELINEAIRIHDKVLIVLSRQSIASSWVEREVYAALEREAREKRTLLFPIRLDNEVMRSEIAWAGIIRNSRHIGDFRGWKEHDKYQEAFNRLLRDLKASEEK